MASKVRDNTVYCAGVRGRRGAMKGRRPLTGSLTAQGEYRTTRQIRGRTPLQKPRSDLWDRQSSLRSPLAY